LAAAQDARERGHARLAADAGAGGYSTNASEVREPRFHLLELRARAFEDGALQIELLTAHELHALDPRLEQRFEVPLQVLAEHFQVLRHRLGQLAGKLVQAETRRFLVIHFTSSWGLRPAPNLAI
jgi:hypothetical protein